MAPTDPSDYDNYELYVAYQHAKEHGPVVRIDELQQEITERWEARAESMYDEYAFDNARERLSLEDDGGDA